MAYAFLRLSGYQVPQPCKSRLLTDLHLASPKAHVRCWSRSTPSARAPYSGLTGFKAVQRSLKGQRSRRLATVVSAKQEDDYDFDLFVIGGGTGGVRTARMSSQFGARVGLCELPLGWVSSDDRGGLGGTCILRGCVPKKLMHYAGSFTEELEDAESFGWQVQEKPQLDWKVMMERKTQELLRLSGVYQKNLESAGVKLIEGRGRITGQHSVEVAGKTFKVKKILVAVGGRPTKAPIEGAEHAIVSDHILNLPDKPAKVVMIGGGYIACEQASIFNSLGSEVHFLIRGPTVLNPMFDEECRIHAGEQYKAAGVKLQLDVTPTKIEKQSNGKLTVTVEPKEGADYTIADADVVLLATGRQPNTKHLGLEEAGVELDDKGGIKVDEFSRSVSADNVYAVGDVTNRVPLTPVARMEGSLLAKHLFGGQKDARCDHSNVASVVFSSPAVAVVGLSEQAAVEKLGNVHVFSSKFTPMKAALRQDKPQALVKVIVDSGSDEVVGFHMVAPDAAEIIQGFATSLKLGITKTQLDDVVGLHPTSAEEFVTLSSPARKYKDGKQVSAG
ncbi:hypothetical protein WJX73_004966 [Symbiochloris irregularis]|uniref:Glutathione-disulfide reductase n=1 Tax=Symbiochloris irregularis TaxID=706552 RepID=A0AAW1PKG6_9CHLO